MYEIYSMNKYLLQVNNISKKFGNVQALNKVNFSLEEGVVYGLLGENGAGKSTLMNILSGIYMPDSGSIRIKDNLIKKLNPEIASNNGIGMVHQEFRLIESFTIKENLIISKSNKFQNNFEQTYKKYSEIFALNLKSSKYISELSVGEKQKVEIMKLLFNDSSIMLLDEPTAVLTPQETQQLKISLETLSKNEKKTIVLITHKLKEIREFTEKIYILKNGNMVAENINTNETKDIELIQLMMGEVNMSEIKKDNIKGKAKLKVQEVSLYSNQNLEILNNISLEIKSGEILGVAGVSGNGQVELANVICGLVKDYKGSIFISDKDVSKKGVKTRKKLKLSYIPENRLGIGLAPGVSVLDNSAIKEYFKARYGPHLSSKKLKTYLSNLINQFAIKAPDEKAEISTLSGGNMQKLLIGRELISNPDVIVASQPTRGLDFNAVEAIHNLLVEQRNQGSSIMLFSEDIDELFKLSDRIIVMFEGTIIKEFSLEEFSTDKLGLAMAGINE